MVQEQGILMGLYSVFVVSLQHFSSKLGIFISLKHVGILLATHFTSLRYSHLKLPSPGIWSLTVHIRWFRRYSYFSSLVTVTACDLKIGTCRQLIEFMKVCEY